MVSLNRSIKFGIESKLYHGGHCCRVSDAWLSHHRSMVVHRICYMIVYMISILLVDFMKKPVHDFQYDLYFDFLMLCLHFSNIIK